MIFLDWTRLRIGYTLSERDRLNLAALTFEIYTVLLPPQNLPPSLP
jgi:hypothetical protein